MIEWYLETATDPEVTSNHILNEFKQYFIGRKRGLDIITTNPLVSRNHGIITVREDNSIYIKDTDSSNGIWINNIKIPCNADCLLQKGDLIGVGGPTTSVERPEIYRVYYSNKKKDFNGKKPEESVINNYKPIEDNDNRINQNNVSDKTETSCLPNNSFDDLFSCDENDKNSVENSSTISSISSASKETSNKLKNDNNTSVNNPTISSREIKSNINDLNSSKNKNEPNNEGGIKIIDSSSEEEEGKELYLKSAATLPNTGIQINLTEAAAAADQSFTETKNEPNNEGGIEIIDSSEEEGKELYLKSAATSPNTGIQIDLTKAAAAADQSFTGTKNEPPESENHNYIFTQDQDEDIVEIISDDEDMFPRSQLFDDVVKIESSAENDNASANQNNEQELIVDHHDDSIFANIKNEVGEHPVDQIDEFIDDSDKDDEDDCRVWMQKLSQQQDIRSCSQEFDRLRKSTANVIDDDTEFFPKFNDNDLELNKEDQQIEDEVRKDVAEIFDSLKENVVQPLKIKIKQIEVFDKVDATSEQSDDSLCIEERYDKIKFKKKEAKKTYIKPPLIEAPYLTKGKRKANEEQKNLNEIKSKKRKPEEEQPSTSATTLLCSSSTSLVVDKSVRNEFIKRNKKKRRKSVDSMSKNEKQQIVDERRKKLKEIAEKQHDAKKDEKISKHSTKPKVKLSTSRGLFLTDADPEKKPDVEKKPKKGKTKTEEKKRKEKPNECLKRQSSIVEEKPRKKYKIPKVQEEEEKEDDTSSSSKKTKELIEQKQSKTKELIAQKGEKTNTTTTTTTIKSILKHNGSAKKMHRVQFNDNIKTLVFEREEPQIETIATICNNQESVSILNETIVKILNWLPIWLQEQKKVECCPPNLTERTPLKMFYHFNNARDYYSVVTPLMLMELWRSIFKDWCNIRNPTILGSVDDLGDVPQMNNNIYLYCHSLTIKGNQDIQMNRGDLVIVEIMLNNEKESSSTAGSVGVATKFGYIKDVQRKRITKSEIINENLVLKTQTPEYKVMYTILIRKFTERLCNRRLIRIRIVSRIDPPLRLFRSVSFLEKSPLCHFILKPTIKDYKISKPTKMKLAITDKLNSEQLMCVYEACQICTRDEPGIYLIQGPPGTGKSFVIKNIIRQLIYGEKNRKRLRILVCAPSNGAVDEIACRLLDMRATFGKTERFKMIRLGPPNSITNQTVRNISVPELIRKQILAEQLNNICSNNLVAEQYNSLLSKINKIEHKVESLKQRGENTVDEELKLAKAQGDLDRFKTTDRTSHEKRKQERILEEYYIENADIICTTLSSCMSYRMEELYRENKIKLNCCIIDEATQSNEQENLIPLMLGINKIILVGDPQQLPPTILSLEAKKLGYGNSLFYRIQHNLEDSPENPIRMLREQYRMHPEICRFPSETFYGGKLKCAERVQTRPEQVLHPYRVFALRTVIDNAESDYLNRCEADLVLLLSNVIIAKTNYNIGIVTPYSRQKELLINLLKSNGNKEDANNSRVAVNTVDGFQGQERDGDSVWKQIEDDAQNRNMLFYLNVLDATKEEYITSLICK